MAMATVICRDCQRSVSDETPSCPLCGRPLGGIGRERRRFQAGHAIGSLGMFTGIFLMMANLPLGLLILGATAVVGWKLTDGPIPPEPRGRG